VPIVFHVLNDCDLIPLLAVLMSHVAHNVFLYSCTILNEGRPLVVSENIAVVHSKGMSKCTSRALPHGCVLAIGVLRSTRVPLPLPALSLQVSVKTCLAGNVVAPCPKTKIPTQSKPVRHKIRMVILSFIPTRIHMIHMGNNNMKRKLPISYSNEKEGACQSSRPT